MIKMTKTLKKGVLWIFSEELTSNDIYKTSTEFYGLYDFDKMRYQLMDFVSVTNINVDYDTMEIVTGMDFAASQTNPYILVALVGSDEKLKDLVATYEASTTGAPWPTKIFPTRIEAVEWINNKYPGSIAIDELPTD
ncbi:MAG: hypothetical protein OCD02_23135 [Spirochaetaceae bacterium]